MASLTRSTRRAEGFSPHVNGDAALTRPGAVAFPTGRRPKRAPDAVEHGLDAVVSKKSKITAELIAKQPPNAQAPISRPAAVACSAPPHGAATTMAARAATTATQNPPAAVTKHQAKVINGIKAELDRLEPQAATSREPGRKLRSQEATRFKSELSAYFPDYDEVIGNDPKEEYALNYETPIVVIDSSSRRAPAATTYAVKGFGDALYTDVFDAQRIDLGFLEAQLRNKSIEDPLPDSLFNPIHKRAERLERSIRNSEKGRAQHEKDQIIRLLEGLQSHDWLRIMGVSGVTDSKKKTFEPAREYFIKGCRSILEKFKNWNLEEKKRKLERERALAEQMEEATEEADEDAMDVDEIADSDDDGDKSSAENDDGNSDNMSTSQDGSEGPSPAKQLRQEAMARSKIAAAKRQARQMQSPEPETPRPFTSFFGKKHERDGALHRQRRTDYRDDETLKSRARGKRRDKRKSRGE
ncbi:hypothetical protein VHEMI03716 [[Torrubiella] hemipterigena]|uniref:Something about silencing protein 4 domain-containing protein n=1 Tax=[Torrubiella] hemipterigena TaxID=1531966 RepID=A0A0A1STD7_9HYPO|nr:hypothetical protein VHEMI03716 [[Torrubiella] hemipterigena]